ncbi:MAG: sigma-54-dependent Fis family transcriptional regulator [Vicinamibacteria bacterium]|nr:sigma-54-dependent Fis family transcriptional regulator [Vicinamibacteria bacterium]
MARVLVVDDEAALRDSLRRLLLRQGHEVMESADVPAALERLDQGVVDLLITDIRLGEQSGLELIARARAQSASLRIVAITAFGSIDVAVQAMRLGADDFLEKPFRVETILSRLERALEPARLADEIARLSRENECLRDELEVSEADDPLTGDSSAMSRVREMIERVAPTTASVLITGETGTGKELVARRLHRRSSRASQSFIALNCSAVAESLAESELFGHERGAFTGADRRRIGRFELAHKGTLFLDEVGDLTPAMQVKLLRALQEHAFERVGGTTTVSVDVRIVAATNRDLEAAIRTERFRADLFYRLNVIRIEIPPLRERPEDIPPLAGLFLSRYGQRPGGACVRITAEAMEALKAHNWPGNVRELENVIHRGVILCRGDEISAEDVTIELNETTSVLPGAGDLRAVLARVEREIISRALHENHGNLTAAGRSLGIERNLLRYKLRKHGLRA